MEVTDIIEEMDLVFWKEEGCRDGMHRSISPALIISFTHTKICESRQTDREGEGEGEGGGGTDTS